MPILFTFFSPKLKGVAQMELVLFFEKQMELVLQWDVLDLWTSSDVACTLVECPYVHVHLSWSIQMVQSCLDRGLRVL